MKTAPRAIPPRETLHIEFKSDRPAGLADEDLVLAVVCLANTEGGSIYLGVEDDGHVTGLVPKHDDPTGLAAMVSNRTVPPLSVRVSILEEGAHRVAHIEVPKSNRLVASQRGTLQRRRLKADGSPECVPLFPHEYASRQADLGLLDYSALTVRGATLDDLDPLERQRLRRAVERYGGDRALLGLDDTELDGALGLTDRLEGQRLPTVAGLLLIGTTEAIRRHLPTHEVAFQVLEAGEVRVNEFSRAPLVYAFERLEELFSAHLREREIQVGLFRVPVPDIDRRAYREAIVNALAHRDWARLGAVHIRWQESSLTVSNPGGFVEGVTLDNLLVTEPRPRNPRLADAFKRIGLAERTGRGVDLIYKGLLRYGRPAPSYARSSSSSVVVELSSTMADLPFLLLILEEERRRAAPLPLDALLVLSVLRSARRADTRAMAQAIQKDQDKARSVAEHLVEAGLVQPVGAGRGRTYTLAPGVYRALGSPAESIRQAGFEPIQQREMVRRYVQDHGSIRRQDAMALCRLDEDQAKRLLKNLCAEGVLVAEGRGKATHYNAVSTLAS